MASARSSVLLREVRRLFGAGGVAGLSDAQLLERFRARSGAAGEAARDAEAAFEALVARHGPMVLGVCRRALADPEEIEDAFQATFLVLVRRAGAVRVDDSLGRWLYGVARRVAAKAGARSRRDRERSSPIEVEPAAPHAPVDLAGPLAALDEELGRLPAKYRDPVVLCHLEGLTHAEAAARLRWPVGTVSGRLSRARGLLRDRLVRRGLAPAAGSSITIFATDAARAAVPESLAAATVRSAASLARGAGTAPDLASTSAFSLMDEVLRAAIVLKLKAAGAVVLALTLSGAVLAASGPGAWPASQGPLGEQEAVRRAPAATRAGEARPAAHRPADEIVEDIEQQLRLGRRPLPHEDFLRVRERIVALVDELKTFYPGDPRLAEYVPSRWEAMNYLGRRSEALAEIRTVLDRSRDPVLRNSALFLEACLRNLEPLSGRAAVALAEDFARQAPGDNRAGELFYNAAARFDDEWLSRAILAGALAVVAALVAAGFRLRKHAIRMGKLSLVALVIVAGVLRFQSGDRQGDILNGLYQQIITAATGWLPLAHWLIRLFGRLGNSTSIGLVSLFVVVAAAVGIGLAVARRRGSGGDKSWPSSVRIAALGFVAAMTVIFSLDACLLAWRAHAVRERVVREFPDSFRGRMVQGERRQHERIGEPFDLEFTDAITGKHVSTKDLRGKVIVVDFWATWCGPCVGEMPEMLRLFAKYHDRGVEFLGVSHDLPEEDGGLEALRKFVKEWNVPWPQYYEARQMGRFLKGEPMDDFSESWGIRGIPTVFLVDAEGKLSSTEARGRLDTLIPRLLGELKPSPPDR
jgi:RNA polymerase sigma factor (sigma-70 family)